MLEARRSSRGDALQQRGAARDRRPGGIAAAPEESIGSVEAAQKWRVVDPVDKLRGTQGGAGTKDKDVLVPEVAQRVRLLAATTAVVFLGVERSLPGRPGGRSRFAQPCTRRDFPCWDRSSRKASALAMCSPRSTSSIRRLRAAVSSSSRTRPGASSGLSCGSDTAARFGGRRKRATGLLSNAQDLSAIAKICTAPSSGVRTRSGQRRLPWSPFVDEAEGHTILPARIGRRLDRFAHDFMEIFSGPRATLSQVASEEVLEQAPPRRARRSERATARSWRVHTSRGPRRASRRRRSWLRRTSRASEGCGRHGRHARSSYSCGRAGVGSGAFSSGSWTSARASSPCPPRAPQRRSPSVGDLRRKVVAACGGAMASRRLQGCRGGSGLARHTEERRSECAEKLSRAGCSRRRAPGRAHGATWMTSSRTLTVGTSPRASRRSGAWPRPSWRGSSRPCAPSSWAVGQTSSRCMDGTAVVSRLACLVKERADGTTKVRLHLRRSLVHRRVRCEGPATRCPGGCHSSTAEAQRSREGGLCGGQRGAGGTQRGGGGRGRGAGLEVRLPLSPRACR